MTRGSFEPRLGVSCSDMTPLAPSPCLILALARVRLLRTRAAQVEQLLNGGRPMRRELELDDRQMLEFERDIRELVRQHQVGSAPIATRDAFWRATYEQWSPGDGPQRFWGLLYQQLGETEAMLSELVGPQRVSKSSAGLTTAPLQPRAAS